MNMQADTLRNQRVYPPLLLPNEFAVQVDDPAPFPHSDRMVLSEVGNIV